MFFPLLRGKDDPVRFGCAFFPLPDFFLVYHGLAGKPLPGTANWPKTHPPSSALRTLHFPPPWTTDTIALLILEVYRPTAYSMTDPPLLRKSPEKSALHLVFSASLSVLALLKLSPQRVVRSGTPHRSDRRIYYQKEAAGKSLTHTRRSRTLQQYLLETCRGLRLTSPNPQPR